MCMSPWSRDRAWYRTWCRRGCIPGGYTGWVYGVGIRGVPSQHALLGEGPAARQRPQGAGPAAGRVVWKQAGAGRTGTAAWAGPGTTPAGPGRCCPGSPPCTRTLRNAASQPITARIQSFLSKVSQNGGVSPFSVEKASHSPCFHFPLQKSPLEILRFPFVRAFSHKELMGHFDPASEFIVKMTKCRQCARPPAREVYGQIPPRSPAASCLLETAPHLT